MERKDDGLSNVYNITSTRYHLYSSPHFLYVEPVRGGKRFVLSDNLNGSMG